MIWTSDAPILVAPPEQDLFESELVLDGHSPKLHHIQDLFHGSTITTMKTTLSPPLYSLQWATLWAFYQEVVNNSMLLVANSSRLRYFSKVQIQNSISEKITEIQWKRKLSANLPILRPIKYSTVILYCILFPLSIIILISGAGTSLCSMLMGI